MEAATRATGEWIGTEAEAIESAEWLQDFADRYLAAWNAHDPDAVAAHVAEDVIWRDPALPEPARGAPPRSSASRHGPFPTCSLPNGASPPCRRIGASPIRRG